MQVIKISNPFNLADSEVFCCQKSNTTISRIAEEIGMNNQQMPFVCFVNGLPILRKFWDISMKDNDHLAFLSLPQGGGGGGSNPIRIVAMVALVVATVYTGGAVGAAYGSIWGGVAAAGVAMGGSMLVNALIPPVIALFLYLFGYRQAQENQRKEVLSNVEKAKKSRNSLNNPDCVNRLHDKYKR